MSNTRLEVIVPKEVAAQVREMTASKGLTVSAWLRALIIKNLEAK